MNIYGRRILRPERASAARRCACSVYYYHGPTYKMLKGCHSLYMNDIIFVCNNQYVMFEMLYIFLIKRPNLICCSKKFSYPFLLKQSYKIKHSQYVTVYGMR